MKKYTDSRLWDEDWLLNLPIEYLLLFIYIRDTCDSAGIWKENVWRIESITKKEINLSLAYALFCADKKRFHVINNRWIYLDYFSFQYGEVMNLNNSLHASVYKKYQEIGLDIDLIRGVRILETSQGRPGDPADPPLNNIDNRFNIFKEKILLYSDKYDKRMLDKFINYWGQRNEGGKKMLFEMQKVFDIPRRLATWNSNDKKPITKININEIKH